MIDVGRKYFISGKVSFYILIVLFFLLVVVVSSWTPTAKAIAAQNMEGAFGLGYPHFSQVKVYANETSIQTVISVIPSEAEDRYYYILDYKTDLVFDYPWNLTVYVPLASGSIIDLKAGINGEDIEKPYIYSNQVRMELDKEDRPHTVQLSYKAYGVDLYSHKVPTDVFVKKFHLDMEIREHVEQPTLSDDCLSPNDYSTIGNTTSYSWKKENAVLKEEIEVTIPTPKTLESEIEVEVIEVEEEEEKRTDYYGWLIGGLIVVLVVIIIIVSVLIYVRFYRPRNKPKDLKKKIANISKENKRLAKENQKLTKKPENPKKNLKKRYCPFCKTGVSEEFDYCPKCAGKVHMIRKCPECGSINLKDEKFKYCPNCGK